MYKLTCPPCAWCAAATSTETPPWRPRTRGCGCRGCRTTAASRPPSPRIRAAAARAARWTPSCPRSGPGPGDSRSSDPSCPRETCCALAHRRKTWKRFEVKPKNILEMQKIFKSLKNNNHLSLSENLSENLSLLAGEADLTAQLLRLLAGDQVWACLRSRLGSSSIVRQRPCKISGLPKNI